MKPVRYKLTKSESNSFNAFAEERVMAPNPSIPKPHLSVGHRKTICALSSSTALATLTAREWRQVVEVRNLMLWVLGRFWMT